jgi:protein SCO1
MTLRIAFISLFLITLSVEVSQADPGALPAEIRDIGVEERLGDRLPEDITFFNEIGETVTLGSFLSKGRPVIITPVYYDCPMLCNLILNGLTEGLTDLQWQIGREFDVITFSIDPDETSELAFNKKKSYLRLLGKPEAEQGWHFLTADQHNITRITDLIGYKYRWSEEAQEFLHGSAIVFISPDGTITRYLYGIQYPELTLRNALFDAAQGKIGSTMERVMLFCYTYDPLSNSYVADAVRIMKVGGVLTLALMSILFGLLWFRKKA